MAAATQVSDIPDSGAPPPQSPLDTTISKGLQGLQLGTSNLNDPRIDPTKSPDQIGPQVSLNPGQQQQGTPLTDSDFELPKEPAQQTTTPAQTTPTPATKEPSPIATSTTTTQLPVSEGQKPLTEEDFKPTEKDSLQATIDQGNQDLITKLSQMPRDQIWQQFKLERDAGYEPDKNLYAQALQKQAQDELAKVSPGSPTEWEQQVQERATEAGKVAQQLASGTVKGISGLSDSINGLVNTAQSAANEANVAVNGVAGNPNASVELRGILEKNKPQMDPGEYQRQSDLILQLAGVENQIKQNDLAQLRTNTVEAQQLQNSNNLLMEQKKAIIGQINPDYSNYRQLQAQRNVVNGTAHGVAAGVDQLGRAATWIAYNSPTGIPLRIYDAHRDLQSWEDELEDHYSSQKMLDDLAAGKDITIKGSIPTIPQGEGPRPPESVSTPGYAIPSPEQAPEAWKVPPAEQAAPFQFNLSPGNLQEMQAHGYGPDPEKIRNVSDALQLAGTGLMPLDLGIGDAVAQRLLGGTSKFLAAGAERAVPLARKVAEVGPYDAIWSAIEAVPELAKGNLGKFAEKVGAAIGLPTGMYATTKVAQAAMKVGADFFANAASDSWKTGGFLPNMARRLTAEAINAPVESVTYAGLMSHDPEEFAQNVTTMAALRGGLALPKEGLGAFKNFWVDKYFGGAKNPPTPYQDYAPHAALDQNDLDKLNATSKETLASVPQDQQNAANSTRQFVGPEAQIHFAPTGEWDAYQKKYAPNSEGVSSRGFYIHDFPSQDLLTPAPRMIFVRGDSIPSALGWETGRLLHAVMPDDLKDRFDAAAAAGIKGGMDAFTQNYYRDLVGHGQGDLSQYPKFSDLPSEEDVANGADPGPNGYTKEMMFNAAGADTARRILNGQSISDLMKDPTLGRQIRQGLVWMIDKMGFPLSSDINPDTFDGINPGIPASIIMEQWMRKFGQRLTTYPLAEPQIGAGAASPGSRPPGTGPVGERPTPGPQPTPPMPVAGTPQGRTFTPSGEWQPHPGPNVVLPGGGGFQHRTRNGVLEVRWANPPNVQIQVPSTPAAVPPEQQKQKPTERTPAVTEGLPAPEPETPTAPQPLNREAVFDRIMQSEGRGSTEATEQGQHELYGFRDRDDPEAYQAIAQARAQYGVGSPEERAVVHQYLGNEFTQAGGEQFTNPAVQSLVASMAHMRGFRGARAMLQALVDGTLRKSYGELPKSTIDAINAMSPEEAIAKLRNVRERYDGLVYPNEWQQFKNGLRNRYDREANQALEIAGGSPNAYKVHSELARAQTYGAARGEEFEGPGGVRNPATGKAMTAEELEVHRLLMDPQTLREEASRGSPLARQLLEEQHGNTWMSELSPEQRSAYQANEPIDWQDQQRRLLAEGAYPQRRSATQVLGDQAQVLRQIQDAGGFSTAAKTWVEPNAEDIAEAHSAFMRLPPEYRQYMRQNFGITSNQLFNPGGTPLEEIPAKLGSGHPLQTGQDVLDHYYATLSNLDRMHRGLPALEYGQTPEVSQNVPREGTRNIQPLTAEAIQSARDAAAESVPTTTATGRARDTGSKAYQEEVETAKNEALLEAHAGSLEPGDDRVQLYRDPDTGKVSASGNQIVPGDLAHDLLTEGVDPAEIALANRFGDMARNREPVTMTYRSAARGHGEAASTERQVREEEQAASPAGQRAQGETAAEDLTKSWIPSRISISGLGKPGKKSILLHGLSTDKIAQNIAHIQEALPEGHPGKRLSKEDWAEAVSRYVENHQHGYSGDGSKALEGTEKIPVTPDTHYVAKPLGREVAQVINMAMADPSARGGSEKALAAREFARENEGYLSPEGEVNPLREEIDRTSQAYQTAQPLWHDKLTSPWETLRTDLVQDVHAGHGEGPGRMREGSEGLDQAISQYGIPKGQFVRAGFMPDRTNRTSSPTSREPNTYPLRRISGFVKLTSDYSEEPLPGQWLSYETPAEAKERTAFMPEARPVTTAAGKDWDPQAVANLAARRREAIRDAGRIPIEPHELAVRPSGTGWGLYDNGALSARYPTRAQAEDTRLFALEHGRQTPVAPNLQTQNIQDYLRDQARRDAAERDASLEREENQSTEARANYRAADLAYNQYLRLKGSPGYDPTRAEDLRHALQVATDELPTPRGWGSIVSEGQAPQRSADVIPPISSERRAQLNQLWQDVSKDDEAFKYPTPKSGSLTDITKAYSTPGNPIEMTYRGGGASLEIANNRTGGSITIHGLNSSRPYIDATEAESKGSKSGGGTNLYQAAFSWAALNGETLYGGSLTDVNQLRRTSNMLSSALRHGTTSQFTPGASQGVDWAKRGDGYAVDTTGNPTAWHTPETAYTHNVAELARSESNMAHRRIPELGEIHYDFDKNLFLSDSDKPLTDTDIEETIKKRDPRFTEGVGLATAKRAIITASALEKRTGEPGEPVVPAIQPPRGPGSPFARILYHPETGAPVPRQQTGKFPTFVPLAHRKED